MTVPLFITSGDLIADRRYSLARDYAADGDLAAAADLYAQAEAVRNEWVLSVTGVVRKRLPGAERAGTRLVGDSLMKLMTANLGLLGFFKYFNFATDSRSPSSSFGMPQQASFSTRT